MVRNFLIKLFLLISLTKPLFSIQAIERIDITSGRIDPVPIANIDFISSDALGKQIVDIINKDLAGTGLFRLIDRAAYLEPILTVSQRIKFSAWRQIKASSVLIGQVSKDGYSGIKVEYHLWDPFAEKELRANILTGKSSDYRRIAHKIADDIYQRFTGELGYFDTKVIFIAETGPGRARIKKMAIMDQDGANLRYLTDGKNLTLTPRFSPDVKKALYLSFNKNQARVHLRDLNSGKDQILGSFKGMTFAPRFSPDGNQAVFSVAVGGTSQIAIIDLSNMQSRIITNGGYINTSPFFSPDGSKITFVSDRSGTPQIYIMDRDGSNQERITFGQGNYYSPVWSPRGDFIAFSKSYQGVFYIGLVRPDGRGERLLTSGYLVSGPAWSPNGRVIMYTRTERYKGRDQGLKSTIATIDLTGHFERTLSLATDASDPNWSNPLP